MMLSCATIADNLHVICQRVSSDCRQEQMRVHRKGNDWNSYVMRKCWRTFVAEQVTIRAQIICIGNKQTTDG